MKKIFVAGIFCLAGFSMVFSQSDMPKGKLTGSIETNNQRYEKDSKTGTEAKQIDQDVYGSNSYLKLDYSLKNITLGLQYEAFIPPLKGFKTPEGQKIVQRYLNYKDDFIDVTIGNFYEQFGSGIIFRSFESRQLGINTSLEGVRAVFSPVDYLKIKAVYGKQRDYFELTKGNLKGGDVELSLGQLLMKDNPLIFDLGAAVIRKNQLYTGSAQDYEPSVNAKSVRLNLGLANFSLFFEYAQKDKDGYEGFGFNGLEIIDKGEAFLLNTSFVRNRFGTNLSIRSLRNMQFRTDREVAPDRTVINYLPALTKQHKYSLLNIYPYSTQVENEVGGQMDMFYSFAKGSFLGGKYGTKIALNFSICFEGDTADLFSAKEQKFFHDINLEIKKKWSKKVKSTVLLSNQYYNKSKIEGGSYDPVEATTFVGDLTYKFTRKKAIRAEVQHLWTEQDHFNWGSGLLELTMAPRWSVFVSDMWNYEDEKNEAHYYNFGFGYTRGTTSIVCSYGRQREGLLCVGGICRMISGYTGFTLSLNTVF